MALRFGIVVSRFNPEVTEKLLSGALAALKKKGIRKIDLVKVPGAFEIPFMLRKLARTRRYSALIALGAVIRGETPHFHYISEAVSHGLMKVMIEEGIPIAFGILTTHNERQALARAGGRQGNKGKEAALTAIEMARLKR